MRLVCPNCGAQYEVDDRVIPDSGRDVQCSSCGHAWYQMPAHLEASGEPAPAEPEAMVEADDDAAAEFEPEAEPEEAAEPAAEAEPAEAVTGPVEDTAEAPSAAEAPAETAPEAPVEPTAPETETETATETAAAGDEAPSTDEAAAEAPPRRDLDESLRSILQEEAAREMEARAADREPPALETEPELGLDAVPDAATHGLGAGEEPSAEVDEDAIANLILPEKDVEPDAGAMAGAAAGAAAEGVDAPRRDLFPDIEEINSTLDSHGLQEEDVDEDVEEARGGFSRGFFAIIFLAALALALYLVAPRLAESVPALEPALTTYVGLVNGAREWLDGMVQGLLGGNDGADQS